MTTSRVSFLLLLFVATCLASVAVATEVSEESTSTGVIDVTTTEALPTTSITTTSLVTAINTTTAAPLPTQQIMTTWEFIALIGFSAISYYGSMYVCAKGVGESTSALTAPARYAGSAASATGGVIGRFIRFLRQGGRVAYIPLAPSDGDLNGGPARRRARDIGHGRDVVDDFAAANEPAPSINDV